MDIKNIDAAGQDVKANDATIMCSLPAEKVSAMADDIDKAGGILAKAQAAKHLSNLLLGEIDSLFAFGKGKPVRNGAREFVIYESTMETLRWLVAEVWEVSDDLAEKVDNLESDFVDFSNAAHFATHDASGATAAPRKAGDQL